WRNADVTDYEALEKCFNGIDTVYHCAGVISLKNGAKNLTNSNIQGTKNIVALCLKNKITKLCFVSSIAACGVTVDGSLIDETTAGLKRKNSAYSTSKLAAEKEVWQAIDKGLNAVIVNPGVILGVAGTGNGSAKIFTEVKKGLIFYTTGINGYVDVRDVVKIMILLTKSDIHSERFILVSENCSHKTILHAIADSFGVRRSWICVGEKLIFTAGIIMETIGKLIGKEPILDRDMGKSSTAQDRYSSAKIKQRTGYEFLPVKQSIQDICGFLSKTEKL
ncbi:MAG: NAD-dependent epimerase/dehydratase family protein, partial [Paludibacter sp.]|nr:NAD-dependent epimerase/dehydratase family protein [Paludibacter sp.]